MRTGIFIFLSLFQVSNIVAQQQNVPLNHQYYQWLNHSLNQVDDTFYHTSCKPYIQSNVNYNAMEQKRFSWERKQRKSWLGRKVWNESFVQVDTGDLKLQIDPLFNLEYGQGAVNPATGRDKFYVNTRGIRAKGDITDKLSFETAFYENQAFFPTYLHNYVAAHGEEFSPGGEYIPLGGFGLVPGQGRAKPFKDGGFDYAMASGYVSYSPSHKINLQIGHGKHFIGDGYRSMLLSDNAFNYPYFKMTTNLFKNKIQYTNIYASLQSLRRLRASSGPEAPFEPKAATFHYLSFIPHERIQIGLFEGIIWQRFDSIATKTMDYNYVVPVIGVNTGINGFNGLNNSLVGITAKVLPIKHVKLYGQFVYDGNGKSGTQAGMEVFNLFGAVTNLNLLAEYNSATNGAYRYDGNLLQSYTHYNQSLAHPSGAALTEIVTGLSYNYKNVFLNVRYIMGNQNTNSTENDPTSNSDYGTANGATYYGSYNNGYYLNTELSYLINPATNMQFTAGLTKGDVRNVNYVYFAFRTALRNKYYDF